MPAGTATVVGNCKSPDTLLGTVKFTVTPLGDGAPPLRVRVPVAICPLARFVGLKDSWETTAGRIVSVVVLELPFSEAEIVATT